MTRKIRPLVILSSTQNLNKKEKKQRRFRIKYGMTRRTEIVAILSPTLVILSLTQNLLKQHQETT